MVIAKKIIQKEADYVLAVKGNQGHLSSAIRDFFDIAHKENFKQLSHHFHEEIDKVTVDRRYFICSLNETDDLFAKAVRRHWSVENELHWVLDVSFREDHSRIRRGNSAENMATTRHITLNMLRQEKTCKKGIKAKRFKAALDSDYTEKIISTIF